MVLRAPRSSIKGKQGKEWISRQRLRQAQVGKKGQLPVLPSLPSRWLGVQVCDTIPSVYAVENIYAGVHGGTLSSENTPALR